MAEHTINIKRALKEASLDELNAGMQERGWYAIPFPLAVILANGMNTGMWPRLDAFTTPPEEADNGQDA